MSDEVNEKVVCLYVFIDEDKTFDIEAMIASMHQLAQEGGLSFNNYAVSIEEV